MSTLTYTQQATLPDGRPCTLTWKAAYRKLDASEGGGFGVEDLELGSCETAGLPVPIHLWFGNPGDWLDERQNEVYEALDSDKLTDLVLGDFGGPDDDDGGDDRGPYGGWP